MLVSVLSPLLLLLCTLLLLPWHMLLSEALWVPDPGQNTTTHTYSHVSYACLYTAVIFNTQCYLIYVSVYEAGKLSKSRQPPQIAIYPPFYGIPMVPHAAPSLIEPKVVTVPPSMENNTVRGQWSTTKPSDVCTHIKHISLQEIQDLR